MRLIDMITADPDGMDWEIDGWKRTVFVFRIGETSLLVGGRDINKYKVEYGKV